MSQNKDAFELNEEAQSVMASERWPDAIKLLKAEMPIVAKDWKLSWNLGWCFFKLNRLHAARKHLDRAAKLAPQNAVCKWALGAIYLQRKQYASAEAYLVESLRIKDAYVSRICLALAYLEQGKIIEAERIHLEGIQLKPQDSQRC
jgi:Tfp pilus assembly protein PilF